jgi:large subunit ribosomal protein L13
LLKGETSVKTFSAKAHEVDREWLVVDATDQALGRLASNVAQVLRGKHKPIYTPHVDTGDFVIVVNCSKIVLTGNKATDKMRVRHSGYPGGLKSTPYGKLLATRPDFVVREAVRGMLPKGSLGRQMLTKLKVYPGPDHKHEAQKPRSHSF